MAEDDNNQAVFAMCVELLNLDDKIAKRMGQMFDSSTKTLNPLTEKEKDQFLEDCVVALKHHYFTMLRVIRAAANE